MSTALNLLTSIKPPAPAGAPDLRMPTSWQDGSGFAGLLQQATQQPPAPPAQALQTPQPPQAARPAQQAPRPPAPQAASPARPSSPPPATARGEAPAATRTGGAVAAGKAAQAADSPAEGAGAVDAPAEAAGTADPLAQDGTADQEPPAPGVDPALLTQGAWPQAHTMPPSTATPTDGTGDLAWSGLLEPEAPGPASAPEEWAVADPQAAGTGGQADPEQFQSLVDTGSTQDPASGWLPASGRLDVAGTVGPARAADETAVTPAQGLNGLHALHAAAGAATLPRALPVPGSVPAGLTYALATPVDAPEFPQALASQISYLVREGVQQAQLHLNPAEMGPLSVHIALQGQQAQVDFAAASSATRTAIENSLSDLAASLQSAGFTLTGGGVSQHPQQQGAPASQGLAGQRMNRGDGAPGEAAPVEAARRTTAAGGVDLYA